MADQANTFWQVAINEAELEARGRFAAQQRAQINGTEPVVPAPPGPAPAWGAWPEGPDVYGEPIDQLPDMTRVGS